MKRAKNAAAVAIAVAMSVMALSAPAAASPIIDDDSRLNPPDSANATTGNALGKKGPGIFITDGKEPTGKGNKLVSEGWWRDIKSGAKEGKVTVMLQIQWEGEDWVTYASATKTVKSGSKVTASIELQPGPAQRSAMARTLIDVDLVGVLDSPERAYSKSVRLVGFPVKK